MDDIIRNEIFKTRLIVFELKLYELKNPSYKGHRNNIRVETEMNLDTETETNTETIIEKGKNTETETDTDFDKETDTDMLIDTELDEEKYT